MACRSQWEVLQGYLVLSSVRSNVLTFIDVSLIYGSDHEAQKSGYAYASWRSAYNLRDALIYIILGGDKRSFAEIAELPPTPPSLDRLSLAAVSYHTRGTPSTHSFIFSCRYCLCSAMQSVQGQSLTHPQARWTWIVPRRPQFLTIHMDLQVRILSVSFCKYYLYSAMQSVQGHS